MNFLTRQFADIDDDEDDDNIPVTISSPVRNIDLSRQSAINRATIADFF